MFWRISPTSSSVHSLLFFEEKVKPNPIHTSGNQNIAAISVAVDSSSNMADDFLE